MKYAAAAAAAVTSVEAYAYHEPWLKTRGAEYGGDVRERLLAARSSRARTTSAASGCAASSARRWIACWRTWTC